ncbi:MAG: methylmalonyl-CoA mutase C-terminal [Planctomycetota bacterium]|nr:MAG: methylmalonyl-CoA mutase C-terminal [Planctomycetota bacterium]
MSHPSTGSPVAPATDRKIRVLVAKVGLDGHDRGAKVIACMLRDAGMEVIYTGLHQSPEQVVEAAMQEDVEALGLSILSGAHMTLFPKVRKLMKEKGLENVLLTGGGIIPPEDDAALRKLGVGKLFGPGTPGHEVVDYIRAEVARRRAGSKAPAKPNTKSKGARK